MLEFPIPPFHKKRPRGASPKSTRPVSALTLISATWDPDFSSLAMTFNAEIDTDGMALETFTVVDGEFAEESFVGSTNTGLTDDSVTIEMMPTETVSGGGVRLTVLPGNGIRAADGSPWEGVENLALPFS